MSFLKLTLVLLFLGEALGDNVPPLSCPSVKCDCSIPRVIRCTRFVDFSELRFNATNITELDVLEFRSLKPLFLDDSLNLTSLSRINKHVSLYNVRGFLVDSNPFRHLNSNKLELKLFDSEFEFYERPFRKLDVKCNMQELTNSSLFEQTILASFTTVSLNSNIKYSNSLCPLVFQHASLDLLVLNQMSAANKLRFKMINMTESLESTNKKFVSNVSKIYLFNVALDELNDNLLDRHVFNSLKTLQVYGNLSRIQPDLFGYSFRHLKSLTFDLFNFEAFMRSSNDWMSSLGLYEKNTLGGGGGGGSFIQASRIDLIVYFNDRREKFLYEEEDFCALAKFPVNKRIYPVINTKKHLNCSCTLVYLIRNYRNFVNRQQFKLFNTKSVEKCLLDEPTMEKYATYCSFEWKQDDCRYLSQRIEKKLKVGKESYLITGQEYVSNETAIKVLSTLSTRTIAFLMGVMGFLSTVLSVVLAVFK